MRVRVRVRGGGMVMVIWPFRGIDLIEGDDGKTLGWGGVGWGSFGKD